MTLMMGSKAFVAYETCLRLLLLSPLAVAEPTGYMILDMVVQKMKKTNET